MLLDQSPGEIHADDKDRYERKTDKAAIGNAAFLNKTQLAKLPKCKQNLEKWVSGSANKLNAKGRGWMKKNAIKKRMSWTSLVKSRLD